MTPVLSNGSPATTGDAAASADAGFSITATTVGQSPQQRRITATTAKAPRQWMLYELAYVTPPQWMTSTGLEPKYDEKFTSFTPTVKAMYFSHRGQSSQC